MKQNRFWSWVVFAIGAIYFLVPLLATVQFSLSIRRGTLSLDAYANVIQSPDFQQTFLYSLVIGVATIIVGLAIVVPAAYFVRLRAPQLRPIIEFVTLLPLIIPPIILVFGYIRLYSSSSVIPLTDDGHRHQHPPDPRLCRAGACPTCIAPSIPASGPSTSRP